MKFFKRFIIFFTVVLIYFLLKEIASLWMFLSGINLYFAFTIFAGIFFFLIYFALLPLLAIIRMPSNIGPTKNKNNIDKLRSKRIDGFRNNKFLVQKGFNLESINNTEDDYKKIIDELSVESYKLRKSYVNRLFYSTSVSQNGFIDSVLILSTSVNLVKDIFTLYNGRVSFMELFVIAKQVYYSIVIGGTEGVEYVTNEIFSKLASESIKSIPFIDKIVTSLVDGFVNATLLTRVSLITENYCKILYIESDRDLYPSSKFIASTAKDLTSEVIKQVNLNILQIAKDKSGDILKRVFNPVAYVLEKSYSTIKDLSTNNRKTGVFDKLFFWK